MNYISLFYTFLKIGLFSIGGGYAILPLIQKEIIDANNWLQMSEFMDVLIISQMTPGPIFINAASFVGMRIIGFSGAITATLACITPSCIIVITLACLYTKYKNLDIVQGVLSGIRPAAVALIAGAALSILLMAYFGDEAVSWLSVNIKNLDVIAVVISVIAFIILRKFKISPIYVMLGSGVLGWILYTFIPV